MAIIVPTLGTIKGKMQGLTFQDNPAGNVLRALPRPRRTSTSNQQAAHQVQQKWINAWQALALADQSDWNTFAGLHDRTDKFGNTHTITGFNWYESINSSLEYIGQSTVDTPPTYAAPSAAPSFELYTDTGYIKIITDTSFDFTDNRLIVWATYPTTRGSSSLNRLRRRVAYYASAPSDTLDFTGAWQSVLGMDWDPAALFPGTNVQACLQVCNKNSGITGPMLCVQASVNNPAP